MTQTGRDFDRIRDREDNRAIDRKYPRHGIFDCDPEADSDWLYDERQAVIESARRRRFDAEE